MIVRIVKMTFKEENIPLFENIFKEVKEKIRKSNGCRLLELYQDVKDPNVFFTYSYWEEEADLNRYRNSDLFAKVWAETKVLFDAKPEAWSTRKKVVLK